MCCLVHKFEKFRSKKKTEQSSHTYKQVQLCVVDVIHIDHSERIINYTYPWCGRFYKLKFAFSIKFSEMVV